MKTPEAPNENIEKAPKQMCPRDIDESEWVRMVCAPVFFVGLVGDLEIEELKQLDYLLKPVLRLASNRIYVDWLDFDKGRKETQTSMERLRTALEGLCEADAAALKSEIWEASVRMAQSVGGLDEDERTALRQVAQILGIALDHSRRVILGAVDASDYVSEDDVVVEQSQDGLPESDYVEWAAKWSDTYADQIFQDFSNTYDAHENLFKDGHGRLHACHSLRDVCFDADRDYGDSGVVVLSKKWAEVPVYVFGDLHGDIEALEVGVKKTGFFATNKDHAQPRIIFLGDYGDRGAGTLAVWLRVCWLKANYPDRVMLLRGNHDMAFPCTYRNTCDSPLSLKKKKDEKWYLPMKQYTESYGALGFALRGEFGTVGMFLSNIPVCALHPSGIMFVHGGVPPSFGDNTGWDGTPGEREQLAVESIADLRKPKAQFLMSWVDMIAKEKDVCVWNRYPASVRVPCAGEGFDKFCSSTGVQQIVCGHRHPSDGVDSYKRDERSVTILNSSRRTSVGPVSPCMGRIAADGVVESIRLFPAAQEA